MYSLRCDSRKPDECWFFNGGAPKTRSNSKKDVSNEASKKEVSKPLQIPAESRRKRKIKTKNQIEEKKKKLVTVSSTPTTSTLPDILPLSSDSVLPTLVSEPTNIDSDNLDLIVNNSLYPKTTTNIDSTLVSEPTNIDSDDLDLIVNNSLYPKTTTSVDSVGKTSDGILSTQPASDPKAVDPVRNTGDDVLNSNYASKPVSIVAKTPKSKKKRTPYTTKPYTINKPNRIKAEYPINITTPDLGINKVQSGINKVQSGIINRNRRDITSALEEVPLKPTVISPSPYEINIDKVEGKKIKRRSKGPGDIDKNSKKNRRATIKSGTPTDLLSETPRKKKTQPRNSISPTDDFFFDDEEIFNTNIGVDVSNNNNGTYVDNILLPHSPPLVSSSNFNRSLDDSINLENTVDDLIEEEDATTNNVDVSPAVTNTPSSITLDAEEPTSEKRGLEENVSLAKVVQPAKRQVLTTVEVKPNVLARTIKKVKDFWDGPTKIKNSSTYSSTRPRLLNNTDTTKNNNRPILSESVDLEEEETNTPQQMMLHHNKILMWMSFLIWI